MSPENPVDPSQDPSQPGTPGPSQEPQDAEVDAEPEPHPEPEPEPEAEPMRTDLLPGEEHWATEGIPPEDLHRLGYGAEDEIDSDDSSKPESGSRSSSPAGNLSSADDRVGPAPGRSSSSSGSSSGKPKKQKKKKENKDGPPPPPRSGS